MRVYFTGMPLKTGEYLELMRGRRVMYSYFSRGRSAYRNLSVFGGAVLDSGAYSVWRRGAKVDVGEYAEYCRVVEGGLDWYANLDVIGDWRGGMRNLGVLEREGLRPVPVWHMGEPWGLLDDLVSGYERVGIGRGPGITFGEMWGLLRVLFARYSDGWGVPTCRFHGFRMTHRRVMGVFPFESVDSTTWISGCAWGELPTDGGRARGFSYLSGGEKARVWLSFFDSVRKARSFKRRGGLRQSRQTALEGASHAF